MSYERGKRTGRAATDVAMTWARTPGACALLLSVFAGSARAQWTWKDVPDLVLRRSHAMSFDPVRKRVVLFGGASGTGGTWMELNDTWEWDGRHWRRFEPKSRPSPRFSPRMAYDFVSRRVILFGGAVLPNVAPLIPRLLNDTWAWDGRNWQKLNPRNVPPGRFGHALEADILRRRIVLFGGARSVRAGAFGGLPHLGDTWEWDGSNWIPMQPKISPRGRSASALAFCFLSKRLVLFGGSPNGGWLGDTWSWDGKSWTSFPKLTTAPGVRAKHGMALEPATGRVILHGGDAGGIPASDTWAWDGKSWVSIATSKTPALRMATTLTTDFATGKPLLFGGAGRAGEQRRGTWLFSANDWRNAFEWTALPVGLGELHVAYEPRRDRILVVGPDTQPGGTWAVQTWALKSGSYERLRPKTSPSHRSVFSTVYHEALGNMMLTGGTSTRGRPLTDTWLFDGTNWTEHKSKTGPGFGYAAYDKHRQTVVLHGGVLATSTWEWHVKTGWVLKTPKTRPGSGPMAYDPIRRRCVKYEGGSSYPPRVAENYVWEWDGNDWTEIRPATIPAPRRAFSLVFVPAFGGVVMCGGGFTPQLPPKPVKPIDTWVWRGKDWAKLTVNPLAGGGTGVYDSGRRKVVLVSPPWGAGPFPGWESSSNGGSIWELSRDSLSSSQPYPRPGETLFFSATLPTQANNPFFVGLSESRHPGIPLRKNSLGATELLPLAPTPLLFATLTVRLLDAKGKAGFLVAVPKIPALIGAEAWAAGFALGPTGVSQITNEVQLRVVH